MAIDYNKTLSLKANDVAFSYEQRDVMLYGLSLGCGLDPINETLLRFVYEKDLVTIPTFATVPAFAIAELGMKTGMDVTKVVHGGQKVEMIADTLPTKASVLLDSQFVGLHDKGEGKGAIVVSETLLKSADNGEHLAKLTSTIFARGDGGFLKPGQENYGELVKPSAVPGREPDQTVRIETREDQALIHRLLGDYNPLHADPDFAQRVGFPRPILHGLCTYGIACKEVLLAFCDGRPERLSSIEVRFSAPIVPGDTLVIEMWVDGSDVSFKATSLGQNAVVLNNGLAKLR